MLTEYLQMLRQFSRDGRLYLFASGLGGFTMFGGIFTVVANLYLIRLGYGPEFVGQFNAAGALAYAIAALPAGAIGRRWSSRRAMIAGMGLGAVSLGLLPLAETWAVEAATTNLQSIWLLSTQVTCMFGFALFFVNGSPFLMAATGPRERNHAFAMQMALSPLFAFFGSMIGGLLPGFFAGLLEVSMRDPAPYRYPIWVAAAALVLGVLAMRATRQGTAQDIAAPVESGLNRAKVAPVSLGLVGLLGLLVMLRATGEGGARMFFNVYMDVGLQSPTALIGSVQAMGMLLAVPAALVTPLLMARLGTHMTYVVASLFGALCLVPMALIPHWSAVGLGFAGAVASHSMLMPAMMVFAMSMVPPSARQMISGVLGLSLGFGFMIMGMGGGHLIHSEGFGSVFLIGAAVSTIGTLLFWYYFRIPRGELARARA